MSAELICSAANCVYNSNGLCSANNISVKGSTAHSSTGTECNTFKEKGFKNAITNVANMNVPGEIRQVFSKDSIEMSPNIRCEAVNCIYNSNTDCNASNVQIHGPGADKSCYTQCETFKEK
ncbi:hypothetical protein CLOACE_03130 [Clostridium acetireducens DSM 10703]|jgi:hypothetical protein|uniref:DUF1540 domain-containing protein n=1 Tax=Clostridium acetireducens DSM 10703 TaxID=1121290 RepID=A0A1E8F1U5_9CLOT|nr:DUF1540 domain-containing protein [Clostridium acetireducens]OFI07484.1 hypothetical protein CLOACE_03130 [Clostridium acetireducens DSM 10703]